MPAYVYILKCSDGSYYVGKTQTSLTIRVAKHNAGAYGGYTAARRPVTLLWHQEFQRYNDAIAAERQIKGWSRAKKEALMAGNFELLQELSRRKTLSRLYSVVSPFETADRFAVNLLRTKRLIQSPRGFFLRSRLLRDAACGGSSG